MLIIKKLLLAILGFIAIGFIIPQNFIMPVQDASKGSYHQQSFWCYPWGKSVTHKGVDIFAKKGTNIVSATNGIVLHTGTVKLGGNIVYILGPKWRFHYYAHLDKINVKKFDWVGHQTVIGTVGTSGNAVGKSPHLHYAIKTIIPHIWRIDKSPQAWRKMYFLNPTDFLNEYFDKQ
ncbi:MAG: M23 family metallopeptidase [Chitinophagales bacterium]|nr:M23 family metallopeptidase [Chitinophagales bacterium]